MDTNNNSKDLGDLESLIKMYKDGFLTDEEFKRAKAKILGDSDTKEETEKVTDELEKGEPESSDNSQENATTGSSKSETPLAPDPSEKTASEKNINTETSDKENEETASFNSEVKKKKNYKKLYWGIGIVAVVALSVCAYLAYLYPTQNELLCFLNQGDKCYAAGLDYQEGTDTIKIDENKALKYLEKGCELDNADSCRSLGHYFNKKNENRNLEKASSYYKKACELGDGASCTSNGLLYSSKDELGEEPSMANIYYEKACQLKDPFGCVQLAYNYELGTGVTQNYEKANELLNGACKVVPSISCGMLAWNYKNGLGIEKNLNKAVELYTKACRLLDSDSCVELGKILKSGEAGFVDKDAANKIFTHACDDLKYGLGCFEMGMNNFSENPEKSIDWISKGCDLKDDLSCVILNVYFKYTNPTKALEAVKKGCEKEGKNSCSILADYYKKGIYIEKNIDKAISLYQKSCDSNIAPACTNLAELLENKHDKNKANNIIDILQKACNLEDGAGCIFLGFMNERGLEITKNINKAQELYIKGNTLNAKSCMDNDDARACLFFGLSFKKGYGLEINNKSARTWYNKACSLNNDYACTFLGELYQYGEGVKKDKNKANNYFIKSCILGDPDGCAQANIDHKNR